MKKQMFVGIVAGLAFACSASGNAQEKGNWRAASKNAKAITGDVAFSSVKIAINFSSYWIAQIRTLTPAEIGAAFPDDEGGNKGKGNLYRLSIPGDKKFLHKNSICASEDTQWVATDVSGHDLRLAFFSGDKMPVLTADALANTTDLCGVFWYVN